MKNLAQISDNKDIITKEHLVAGYEPLLPATPLDPGTKYLNGLKQWATIYTHPATHPPSIIVQDTSNRFVTDAEKSTWNGKLNASSYTASDVLTKIKTVDGSGSGLDADLLDGKEASAFSLSTHNHSGVYQPIDADLTAIAGLTGTSGLLRKTAENTWILDTNPAGLGDMTVAVYGGSASGVVAKADSLKETRIGASEKFWVGTKAQYDAIETKDSTTCYITTDEDTGSCVVLDETGHIDIGYMPTSVTTHLTSTLNPHNVTANQVGLGNATNESKATMFTNPTFTGVAKATGNTSYTTAQLRNIILSTTAPTSGDGVNGDIWMVYTA